LKKAGPARGGLGKEVSLEKKPRVSAGKGTQKKNAGSAGREAGRGEGIKKQGLKNTGRGAGLFAAEGRTSTGDELV